MLMTLDIGFFFGRKPKKCSHASIFCDKKILATNSMRGKINLRAKFCEHSKKCDHFFASNKIRCEQIYIFTENCIYPFFFISYIWSRNFTFFATKNMKSRIPRPIFCDKTKICDHLAATITKKKLILRALRQKSDDGKCDQKKTYEVRKS